MFLSCDRHLRSRGSPRWRLLFSSSWDLLFPLRAGWRSRCAFGHGPPSPFSSSSFLLGCVCTSAGSSGLSRFVVLVQVRVFLQPLGLMAPAFPGCVSRCPGCSLNTSFTSLFHHGISHWRCLICSLPSLTSMFSLHLLFISRSLTWVCLKSACSCVLKPVFYFWKYTKRVGSLL